MRIQGTYTAIVTPFVDGGSDPLNPPAVDWESLDRLVDWQLQEKVDGLVVCGTTGESATLDDEERLAVIEHVCKRVAGRVPIVAGTGTNCTAATIDLTREAKTIGATAALIVSPYYNKPTQEGLFRHFTAVADHGGLPIVLYNIPGRTSVEISTATISRLCDHPRIVAIKQAVDSVTRLVELSAAAAGKMALLAGDDPLVATVFSVGGTGVISASASVIPRAMKAITDAGLRGDLPGALAAQQSAMRAINALFVETNPAPAKTVLKMLGRITSDALRLPLAPVSASTREMLHGLVAEGVFGEAERSGARS